MANHDAPRKLAQPPIVEAILDIDCDLPPNLDIVALRDPAKSAFAADYPTVHVSVAHEHRFEILANDETRHDSRRGIDGYGFMSADRKTMVQIRRGGFSFNSLAPYPGMDALLPGIKRCWDRYRELAAPVCVRAIKVRNINRIDLPASGGRVNLSDYLRHPPETPDDDALDFLEFMHHHRIIDRETQGQAVVVLASRPAEGAILPVILDITAGDSEVSDVALEWDSILPKILELRKLKDRIFEKMITDTCRKLFE